METLHQKSMFAKLYLDSMFYLFFSNLTLLMINLPKCPFPTMISNSWDKATPSSMIAKPIGDHVAFFISIAMMFLVGYSSHQVLQHFPCPHLDRWVHTNKAFPVLWFLQEFEFPMEMW